jgi:hypothetical protein
MNPPKPKTPLFILEINKNERDSGSALMHCLFIIDTITIILFYNIDVDLRVAWVLTKGNYQGKWVITGGNHIQFEF